MTPHDQSSSDSSQDDYDDDPPVQDDQRVSHAHSQGDTPVAVDGATQSSAQQARPSVPVQKRRRVTRACDECRRKKIKCDGKQPCTHCTVYSYECTYDQPSHRRRNPAPQYVEALEIKLQRAESILKTVLPNVDLDDISADQLPTPDTQSAIKREAQTPAQSILGTKDQLPATQVDGVDTEKDSMLESMVEHTGSLDLDDEGHWDFHGHSSGRAFLQKMREQFGDLMGKPGSSPFSAARKQFRSHPNLSPSSSSAGSFMMMRSPTASELPRKTCALQLCENALNDCCAILRFIHQPSFYTLLNRVYDTKQELYGPEELKFLPLLYSTLALGTLFATSEQSELQINGFENAIDQGTHWYKAARSMMDVTECRDLISIQTVLVMILFLQSSSRLSTCYSHLGIVLRSAVRMGLHRLVANQFNPVEQEVRKRTFWCIRKLDTYVGALLGLPTMLKDEDIDQEYPLEVDDEYITKDAILPMPPNIPSKMAAFNAHTSVVQILAKTVKYIYPVKGSKTKSGQSYIVSHARIREIEQDLQKWEADLPVAFRPGGQAPKDFIRIQNILRMAYAHIEVSLYRPFLHYVSRDFQAKNFDQRSYACAAACVSVSRNIVHLTGDMKRKGLLVGSYWFYMYTTFFAVISLVFYVLENPHSHTSTDILRDAHEGKDTLALLAKRSLAADRCSKNLAELFEQLPQRLKGARMNIASQKKRQATGPLQASSRQAVQSAPNMHSAKLPQTVPRRSQTTPTTQQGSWTPSQATQPSEPRPMLLPQNFDNIRRGSQDTFPTNTIPPSGSPYPPATIPGHGVPDLSAMMFPSEDPFEYPNQPMTTLENRAYVKQEGMDPPQYPMQGPPSANLPFQQQQQQQQQNLEMPMYGGLAPFMVPEGQQDFHNMSMSGPMPQMSNDNTGRTAMNMPPGQEWPMASGQQQGQRDTNFDQLFGEDWGGWMSQGYRQ